LGTEDQGPRTRDRGPGTEDQGPRTRDRRTRDRGAGTRDGLRPKNQAPRTKVRYLRMLCNSMAAAALATAYVIALVLHLNPTLSLHPARLAPLIATVGLFYIIHLTVICYVLLVLRQLLAREVFSPAWLSV